MDIDWDACLNRITTTLSQEKGGLPSVSLIASRDNDPFRVLISTLLSLRTKDEVTLAASDRLFALADTPGTMLALSPQTIEQAIYPAGFYRVKAKNILEVSRLLIEHHNGQVPCDREQLLALPGVGVKTANLTLNLGFAIEAICVDTHVHRISNRLGWINTRTPEESEKALERIMPRRHWIPLNELLVTFGQQVCKPVSPLCSRCLCRTDCPRVGVIHSR
jgi:endonuclease-3